MEWGANFTEALMRFEERVSTPSIARTVTLITKASEMSGQIGAVLSIASSDAKMTEVLKKERLGEMFIYTAIVYLSFFVFLFVVGVLTTQFLPVLAKISSSGLPTSGPLIWCWIDTGHYVQPSSVSRMSCPGTLLRAHRRADG
jgi:flagellar protein FlaJ